MPTAVFFSRRWKNLLSRPSYCSQYAMSYPTSKSTYPLVCSTTPVLWQDPDVQPVKVAEFHWSISHQNVVLLSK